MTVTRVAIRVFCYGLALGVLAVLLAGTPRNAFADSIPVSPQQILPLGANQCASIVVSDFRPYVYENAVNSFDFSVSDASYVDITASVGNTSILLNFMRREIDSAGVLHMHIDTPSIPVGSSLPITVTLLSSPHAGSPVCAVIVTFTVQGSAAPAAPAPVAPAPSTPSAPSTSTQSSSSSHGGSNAQASGTTATSATSGLGVISNPLAALCATTDAAYVLWVVLLVLYVLLIIGIAWPSWPANMQRLRTIEWRFSGILLPLVLLLALWYFAPVCRGAGWMPVLAVLVAIAGSFAVLREKKPMKQLLLIDQKDQPKKK